ncbi:MAG: N-acyl-D-amino-acid deacylase family protein [Candidatus Binatia bacterium]
MHDLIIQGGTLVDGTGRPARTGDVAIADGRIVAVGKNLGAARRTIKADGLLVTPGWVDIHTHYDGQVTWDPLLTPSLWHGVTSVVMGNCGVGFAPAALDRHEWLIGLMEGVEDIPGASLAAGIRWNWETFPEYLDALSALPHATDVGAMLTHGALRAYVMGERGAKNKPATADDLARMTTLVRAALEAGAIGVSTSRTKVHIAIDGEPVPGTFATEEELTAIARGIVQSGRGLLEVANAGVAGEEPGAMAQEMAWMRNVSLATGCPITFLLVQNNAEPDLWRELLRQTAEANRAGARITPQAFGRPTTILFGLQNCEHPFRFLPSFAPLLEKPLAEQVAALRDPALRARLLSEEDPNTTGFSMLYKMPTLWDNTYAMGSPLNYFPSKADSIAAIARQRGCDPREVAYDRLLERDGHAFLMYAVVGYADGTPQAIYEMITHPLTIVGGSDAGAHCRIICDAGLPTFTLTEWVRDADPKYRLTLEQAVKRLTHDTARLFGMQDRGTLEAGMRADLNLIDYANLASHDPYIVDDLPAGKSRLMQTTSGYEATFVSGEMVQERGQETGARPGRVIRSCSTQSTGSL